ncbi:MAG: EAL domain-containing protein [Gammaproteobacteria bacterium]|nr:EAL domain-containing protein [Gammaproteobacteria bacterium]MDH3448979.1 EAL domain-containing protein [Gammaproteobacteria bacterium]
MIEAIAAASFSALVGAGLTWYWIKGVEAKRARRRQQDSKDRLHTLIEATVGTTGETYFYALVRELSEFLSVDAVFLAALVDDAQQSYQTQAYWCDGGYIMNHPVSLQHSPCGDSGSFWYIENSASELFPQADLLRERFPGSGFFAIRLQDSGGRPIGVLAGMTRGRLQPQKSDVHVIKLFAARAAAELERKLALGETLMEKERAQITLHSIGDGVITTDSRGRIDYMNPVAEALTGWRYHQAMGLSMEAVVHLEDEQSGMVIPDPAQRCLSEQRVVAPKTDNVLISRGGERYSIQGTAAPMIDSQGNSIGVVLVFKDVTDSRRMQKKMVHQATHDPLTGLVNRSEFEQRLEKALQSARDFENTHALLFLDLDQFKIVNDSAGHVAGDELLKQISSLLAGQLRGRDTLGRLGGDEFSVLLENCPLDKARNVADILIDVIREYRFVWDHKTYQVGVSIGIVPITAESSSRKQLMHDADQACYAAKDLGRGRACIHNETDGDATHRPGEKLQRRDIRDALASEHFLLLYQPIIALDPEQTRLHTRAEVLLRMLDDAGNVINPGAFLPAAARFGLMSQIDRWVIERVFTAYPHVFMQNPDLVLSLNLSAASIADESLVEYILQRFDKTVVKPHQICFEISETAFSHDLANASRLVRRLQAAGCSFALDDFGSGLTSFAALKDLPLDFVKIDGNLVRDICGDAVDCAMVESINAMAHLLGIRTIAESVDGEAAIEKLKSIGIDYAQGYYLGDLLPLDEFGSTAQERRLSEIQLN